MCAPHHSLCVARPLHPPAFLPPSPRPPALHGPAVPPRSPQGFFNALVYGMDPFLLKELKHKCLGTAPPWDHEKEEIEIPNSGISQWQPARVGEDTEMGVQGPMALPAALPGHDPSMPGTSMQISGEDDNFEEVKL